MSTQEVRVRGSVLEGAGKRRGKGWRKAGRREAWGAEGWGSRDRGAGGSTDRRGQHWDRAQPPVWGCHWACCLLGERDGNLTGGWEEGSTVGELGVTAVGLTPPPPPPRPPAQLLREWGLMAKGRERVRTAVGFPAPSPVPPHLPA